MKKVILMAACLFAITTASNAQETKTTTESKQASKHEKQHTPEQHAQRSVDELNATVTLTEDQKPKIYNLALTRSKNIDVVKEKYKGQADKKEIEKSEIQAIRKTYRQGVKAILTPEQLEKEKAANQSKKVKDEAPKEANELK